MRCEAGYDEQDRDADKGYNSTRARLNSGMDKDTRRDKLRCR